MSDANDTTTFRTATRVGEMTVEPADPARDAALLHGWLTHPASRYWEMGDLTPTQVRDHLTTVTGDDAQDGWLLRHQGTPIAYAETYDPARTVLDGLPPDVLDHRPGDLGMHVLVAPPPPAQGPRPRIPGLTDAVMTTVLRFCFAAPARPAAPAPAHGNGRGALRVVVEPDARNRPIHAKNAAAGFRVLRDVDLVTDGHTKRARLSVCTRDDFAASPLGDGTGPLGAEPAAHLRPALADAAHRHLVAKALAEFTHERLFLPRPSDPVAALEAAREVTHDDPREYVLVLDDARGHGRVTYRFSARRYPLEHWVIDESSLRRTRAVPDGGPSGADERQAPVDALELVAELQPLLGIPEDLLPTYLEELSSTLAGAMAKREREALGTSPSSPGLVDALAGADAAGAFQAVESAMTEGHPGFVANNGRIGFSLSDYRAYAPERAARLRLMWLAARREHTHLSLGAGQSEPALYGTASSAAELSGAERAAFADRLTARGLDPGDYLYLPVHPWQWEHRVAITFAADVAREDLVPLGPGADEYTPQQSIRTLFNTTRPDRHYVKVATAIQNMGFLRGLSPKYMRDTPAVNDWVADVVTGDETLRRARFEILREVAAIGYTGDVYHRTRDNNPYRKMLAALWRESPLPRLAPGERVATMAALLHRDTSGTALATSLIRASGLDAAHWVRSYLDAYLYPLVHCLLAHDLAFMPHGENLVLVLRDHVVTRTFMKDIGEETAVLGPRALPAPVQRVRAVVPDDEKALAVFTDMFDGVLRHLSGILAADGVLPTARFWTIVGDVVDRHHDEHPAVAARHGRELGVDLRAQTFAHSCLNRLQLRDTRQMVDLTDQASSLIYAGRLTNPIGATVPA
ncbi:GNAT family N-acetyltransferase [Myceligenerans salitolerans]|uniref:Lysine N-acyltransferase MbtK n=1 Tax=Myceligenerans salitolerans TaxID=1230528 RepID=A0ABS3IE00_9MICO|nr:GNAT family N-acetyltransferase [Myceligenerans salitolerans]MBO0610247.1 GNAT family N-acetyltransferase [Myceligenerans salitolerans]